VKRDPQAGSEQPENWTTSGLPGGTPGAGEVWSETAVSPALAISEMRA